MNRQQIEEKYPAKEFGELNVNRTYDYPFTGKKNSWGSDEKDYSEEAQVIDNGWEFFLNHSCDEWVIGSLEQAEKFSNDLQEAIAYTKSF